MKKNIVALSILLVLFIGLATYFLLHNENQVLGTKTREFNISAPETIVKIVLSNAEGDSIILKRKNKNWIINDTYLAKEEKIKELLSISTFLEIKQRVPQRKVKQNKVEFYGTQGLARTFYIAEKSTDKGASYASIDTSSFLIYVAGERPNFDNLFSPKMEQWRDLKIMNFETSKLKKISVEYFNESKNSFTLDLSEENPILYDNEHMKTPNTNSDLMEEYVRYFHSITAKKILGDATGNLYQNLKNQNPHFVFETMSVDGFHQKLTAYLKSAEKDQYDISGQQLKYDVEFFYGIVGNDVYLLDYFSFDDILIKPIELVNE